MEVVVKKSPANPSSPSCVLPWNAFKDLNLSEETIYTIHFGVLTETCRVNFSNENEKVMYFPENIFTKLKLLDEININIWKTGNNIFLGPVVGIHVSARSISKMNLKKPSNFVRQHYLGSLSESCICYFFCAKDINWLENTVRCVVFVPNFKKWDFRWLPLPNVLYDRIMSMNKIRRPVIAKARERFKKNTDIKPINNLNRLGKWEVCKALAKYDESRKYLPETIAYTTFNDVVTMLNKYDLIFLKSYYGYGGEEVASVEKTDDKYKLNYFKNGRKEIYLDNIDKLQEFITKFIGSKRFIIQQGIRLLSYNGCNLDIRMFIMKNESGKWEPIIKEARIAKGNFKITNIHIGGVFSIYEELYLKLKAQHGSIEVPSSQTLSKAAITLASYIEKELGSFGEIGLDLGIDTNGRIWIIEANAKPDKELSTLDIDINGKKWLSVVAKFYSGTMKNDKVMPQALGIFRYAKYLSGANKT